MAQRADGREIPQVSLPRSLAHTSRQFSAGSGSRSPRHRAGRRPPIAGHDCGRPVGIGSVATLKAQPVEATWAPSNLLPAARTPRGP